jgi:hypothetical protein
VLAIDVSETVPVENVVVLIKVIPPPAAGVSHLSPVAVELSATKSAILREQSQRIVLGA